MRTIRRLAVWAILAATILPAAASIRLDIPPRRQWDTRYGYCGECSIQSAALFFGSYISQYRAREIIDPAQWQDVWVPENSGPVLDALRLHYEVWNSANPQPQYRNYLVWIKGHLQRKHPVIFDVYVQGGTEPDYDHIMLAVGFVSPDATTYHDDDRLLFNDHYESAYYSRSFGSIYDTRAMNGNGSRFEYSIPRDVDYGCAVTGVRDESGTLRRIRLKVNRWNEPNVTRGLPPAWLTGTLSISGLTPGQRYALLRYDDWRKVPVNHYLSSAYTRRTLFTATAKTQVLTDGFWSNALVIYRCVPYP